MWGISPDLALSPLIPAYKKEEGRAHEMDFKDFARKLMKNNVKVVFGSDYFGKFEDGERTRRHEIWLRTQAFGSNFEALKHMTSAAGELMAISGPRNPYKVCGLNFLGWE